MISKKKALAIVLAAIILTGTLTFAATKGRDVLLGDKAIVSRQEYELMREYSKVFLVRNILQENYVDKVDEKKLVEGAVRGIASGIGDPYTVYWDPKEYEQNTMATSGEYAGVGLVVEPKDGRIIVASPIEDTPADKAGIRSGDVIIRINDKAYGGDKLDEAVSVMRGEPGTKVKLTIVKAGTSTPVDIELTRANIIMQSVRGEVLNNNIGYIRIAAFQTNTAEAYRKTLNDLKSKGIKGLILDLRNNGGGLLDQCVKVADTLLGEGTIVYTIDNRGNKEVIPSDKDKIEMPLTILVNGGTASASEIVSGAVKDTKSGTLIGTKTFGKGLVQTVVRIPWDNSAVKVTIARYYTPSGISIQGTGIDPNIVIDIPESVLQKAELTRADDVQLDKAIEVIKQQMK